MGWTCEPHLAVTQSITSNTLGLTVSHSHINSKKCLTHEGASNQPTYATDINIIKEIKGDVKNQPQEDTEKKSEPQMGFESNIHYPPTIRAKGPLSEGRKKKLAISEG